MRHRRAHLSVFMAMLVKRMVVFGRTSRRQRHLEIGEVLARILQRTGRETKIVRTGRVSIAGLARDAGQSSYTAGHHSSLFAMSQIL